METTKTPSILRQLFGSSYGPNPPTFFFWYEPGTSKADKALIFKIDFFILTYGCLAFFTKYLDSQNINNSYVSGMKEDLGMYGNELNTMLTCFNVGTIIGGIPSNLILTKVPARYWLPVQELIWGILTLLCYRANTPQQLYPLRFFIGLLEGSSYAGMQYLFGSWYKKSELGKRTCIFTVAAYVGSMFGGFMQSGMHAGMDGRNGIAAWRWPFIFDGIITMFIAIYGVIFFPDTPERTTAWYFSAAEKQRAKDRLIEDGREQAPVKWTGEAFQKMLHAWQTYVLTVFWALSNCSVGKFVGTIMPIWLADAGHYSTYEINNIPTAVSGWNIVISIAACVWLDATGRRLPFFMCLLTWMIFGTIMLVVWSVPLGLKFVAYFAAATDAPLFPVVMSWSNILCGNDALVRSMTLAFMNSFGQALSTIVNQFLYETTSAPSYRKGTVFSLCALFGIAFLAVFVRWLELRDEREKALLVEGEEVYVTGKGEGSRVAVDGRKHSDSSDP